MNSYSFDGVNDALVGMARIMRTDAHLQESRAGKTVELTNVQLTLRNPRRRYITIKARKASLPAQIAETMWVLSGRNDVEWLSNYLPRAADFSDDGVSWRAGYGPRLRHWGSPVTGYAGQDQLMNVIRLLQSDPDTRRAVMSIWDPAQDVTDSKDIPCNNWLHFLHRDGKLNLHVAIRSNDLIWGWSGINQFEWSVLLEIVSHYAGLEMGGITYSISSLHVYEHHFDRLREIADEDAVRRELAPTFHPDQSGTQWDELVDMWFDLEQRIREGNYTDREIRLFPERMLRSWLGVLAWHWQSSAPLALDDDTDFSTAVMLRKPARVRVLPSSPLVAELDKLHREKDAVYGNSWCKRGEFVGILANVARKVDRLGKSGAGDTRLDTLMDLTVYLAKYLVWMRDLAGTGAKHQDDVQGILVRTHAAVHARRPGTDLESMEEQIAADFEGMISDGSVAPGAERVDALLLKAYFATELCWLRGQEPTAEGYVNQ